MSRIRIGPIVEGHAETQAVRILLRRVWEMIGGEFADVVKPTRLSRGKLTNPAEIKRACSFTVAKLAQGQNLYDPALVVLLADSDESLPCQLGPAILETMQSEFSCVDSCCVLANMEYETWFVGAAPSLTKFLEFDKVDDKPEQARQKKKWIESHWKSSVSAAYSAPVDQPRMTEIMDLRMCRGRCPSFDKLCRELEKRLERKEEG